MVNDGQKERLDRSIASLQKAVGLTKQPAPVLADLAAALIVRAERNQSPRDLLDAHERAEQALQHDPLNAVALFNRALALDRFGLVDEVAKAWQAYLAADSTSGWADVARLRLRKLLKQTEFSLPRSDAPVEVLESYAAAEPLGARQLGMDRLLAEWGAAVEAGDTSRAEDHLRGASVLGETLSRRPGDASLADAVLSIRAVSRDSAATRALARAHVKYGLGKYYFDRADYKRAEAHFSAAEVEAGASAALSSWTRVYLGTTRVFNGKGEEWEWMLHDLAASDSVRYPALVGRARWMLGTTQMRTGRWERGLENTRRSTYLFAVAGERENEAATLLAVGDAHFLFGDPESGYAAVHRALQCLKPYRASAILYNVLTITSIQAGLEELPRSAIRLQNEGVGVATRNGLPLYSADAHVRRAHLLATLGDRSGAKRDIDAARPLVSLIPHSPVRAWFTAHLREAEAIAILRDQPGEATQAFDSVAAFFNRTNPSRGLPALVRGAEVRLVRGDPAGAVVRLERIIHLLNQQWDPTHIDRHQVGVLPTARGVVDHIAMLELAEGRVSAALDYMDRGRASLARLRPALASRADRRVNMPGGEIAVRYAMVADTLLVWTVAGSRVELYRRMIDTVQFVRTLQSLETKLEKKANEAEVRPTLSALYDWLVRPVEARLGGSGTRVVIITDEDLEAVPFAALYDAQRKRHLVEDYPLRFAVSLQHARLRPAVKPADSVLLVADPALAKEEYPLLGRLAHARNEVRSISGGYDGVRVLVGSSATRSAFETALRRTGMLHFAGHAVFNEARPERSSLLLAPVPGKRESGRITAAELAQIDLRHVRLAVLAACRTERFMGLSRGLLAAGVGGAVGSTWDVDDHLTALLMIKFHQEYQDSRDGPQALQAAQLAMRKSDNPALRTPAAWAGFRYVGW